MTAFRTQRPAFAQDNLLVELERWSTPPTISIAMSMTDASACLAALVSTSATT
jgi:hypothetical protein